MLKNSLFFMLASLITSPSQAALPTQFEGANLLTDQTLKVPLTTNDKKGLVLIFMSSKCPCSNSHVALLKKLLEQHTDFRFLIIHSNADESLAEAKTYFKDLKLNIEVLQDQDAHIADQMKAFKTPHAFVITSKGELAYQGGITNSSHAPSADRQFLAEALEDIKNNKPVRTPEGRTLGCVITRPSEKSGAKL